MIKDIETLFELEIKNRLINFETSISERVRHIELSTDKDRLRQVCINLISNALKFWSSLVRIEIFEFGKIQKSSERNVLAKRVGSNNQEEAKEYEQPLMLKRDFWGQFGVQEWAYKLVNK